ncbi:MAG: hypothetical protein FIA95_03810 [Gemmatimonadetes bacterium]|nr:hypothetical protein [Gemmatimonadota bacterium]
MSAFLPFRASAGSEAPDVPEPRLQGILSEAERTARWEVRAAQWRAVELARAAFGPDVSGTLLGVRPEGALRGLLKLDVPFADLDAHRQREAGFLGMVGADPLMAQVPMVFVLGPDSA